jgi:CheY-like chemotaxis protein
MKNVLLVDDDSIFNFLNTKILQSMGFANDIHTALNGKQAIDLFNDYYGGTKALPDIILLDLSMPIMDGFGFLEAFRRLDLPGKDNVKVIIVTSSNSADDIKRAKALGVSQYLTKPIREESLKEALMMAEMLISLNGEGASVKKPTAP